MASASASATPSQTNSQTSTTALTTPTSSSNTSTTTQTNPTPTPTPTRAQTEARAAVLASLNAAGASHTHSLQTRAADLHANASAIDGQQAQLAKASKGLARESARLEREVDAAVKGMKDFGDVQNWAEMLERDFMVLEETMRLVEGGEEVERESGGSTWRG